MDHRRGILGWEKNPEHEAALQAATLGRYWDENPDQVVDLAAITTTYRIWRQTGLSRIHRHSVLYGDGEVAISNIRTYQHVREHLHPETGLTETTQLYDAICDPDREIFPGATFKELLEWSSSIIDPSQVRISIRHRIREEARRVREHGPAVWLRESAKLATLALPSWYGTPWCLEVVEHVTQAIKAHQSGEGGPAPTGENYWRRWCGLEELPPEGSGSGEWRVTTTRRHHRDQHRDTQLGVRQINLETLGETAAKEPWKLRPFEAVSFKLAPKTAGIEAFRQWRWARIEALT